MELSSEDLLRLNVLLANDVEAIRIDEQAMTVHGLARGGEARITLRPTCRAPQYLKRVREMLSSHVLGSPGGYPVFLQRWTRMGQAKDGHLEKLLLLGEPEAVIAVAGAPGLSDELARRAWWALPSADNARRMLDKGTVIHGEMGKILADFLVEYLPFEDDPLTIIDTVRLVLRPGLIMDETRRAIWKRGTHKNAYHIGFLQATPDELPEPGIARADLPRYRETLAALARSGNTPAALLRKILDAPGQAFLRTCEGLLQHPIDKYTVAVLLDTIGTYFAVLRPAGDPATDVEQAQARADAIAGAGEAELGACLRAAPALRRELTAAVTLAQVSEALATPILARTTATGSVLRRNLDPVLAPLLALHAVLRLPPG